MGQMGGDRFFESLSGKPGWTKYLEEEANSTFFKWNEHQGLRAWQGSISAGAGHRASMCSCCGLLLQLDCLLPWDPTQFTAQGPTATKPPESWLRGGRIWCLSLTLTSLNCILSSSFLQPPSQLQISQPLGIQC